MTDITQQFDGSAPVEITWTATQGPDGLADDSLGANYSSELDIYALINTSSKNILDIILQWHHKTATGTLGSNPHTAMYVAGTVDDANGDYPVRSVDTLVEIDRQAVDTANTTEYSNPISLRAAFGGVLPPACKFAMFNGSGLALAGTAGQNTENKLFYRIVYGVTA